MIVDEPYMKYALRLARRAIGQTSPNPMVGAVIVKHGRVVGVGYHRRAGLSHAEAIALRKAGASARGATLYVTLEPCNHTGRTPPCCDAILAAGIRRVVVAVKDPNPITNGRGLARLRRAGLQVVTGVLAKEAQEVNAPFWKAMRQRLPFVVAKAGQSLDGKIATATGESQWITSAASRRMTQHLRRRVDAILVGVNTVLRDDPRLTVRVGRPQARRPLRIILDSRLRIPLAARCLAGATRQPTLIATTANSPAKQQALQRKGVEVLRLPAQGGRVPLARLCRRLVRRGVQSMVIEGGGEVLASAFSARLVDRVIIGVAPLLIGGRNAVSTIGGGGIRRLSQAIRLTEVTYHRVGPDLCVEGRVIYPSGHRTSDIGHRAGR